MSKEDDGHFIIIGLTCPIKNIDITMKKCNEIKKVFDLNILPWERTITATIRRLVENNFIIDEFNTLELNRIIQEMCCDVSVINGDGGLINKVVVGPVNLVMKS